MPPVYIKGGVWSNIEDEILKAAVQKYGLNQWSRVASLLTKKSAKQAKARWNEWINPKINKTEWTREEDEKLLNLVKLLPNQWRSIAPIMGRTATHCVERYQKLLEEGDDEADDNESDDDLKFSGPGIESLPAAGGSGVSGVSGVSGNTHIGDLNINPESIPAKPDEDELEDADREMLFEARARLANTKGKKAKRREREKMLEETKRISLLQKRRELKAAGLNTSLISKNKKASKEFDYNADIPFEHQPPPGLYDTTDEDKQAESLKRKFQTEVHHKGLKIPQKDKDQDKQKHKQKQKQKHAYSEISGQADIKEPPSKRTKLEMPDAEDTPKREEYSTTDLAGVFDHSNESQAQTQSISQDIDDRITQATKEIKQEKAKKSSLLLDGEGNDDESNTKSSTSIKSNKDLNPKQQTKLIRQLVHEEISKLPPPQIQQRIPIPMNDNLPQSESEPLLAAKISETKHENTGEGWKSQVVKKGLNIPKPAFLKDLNKLKLSTVDQEIAQEFQRLIKSDYRQYVDSTYEPSSPQSLTNPENRIYQQVERDIKELVNSQSNSNSNSNYHYVLPPPDGPTRTEIIHQINQLNTQSSRLQEVLYEQGGFEDTTAIMTRINELHDMYNREVLNHQLFKQVSQNEEMIMKVRSTRLNQLVDSIVQEEQQLGTNLKGWQS